MWSYLNKAIWIVFIVITPLTFIGVFSQNAIPGDILYPVKLGLENVGGVIFAMTPEGRASYNTTLSDRRFDEAQQLILTRTDSEGLSTLVNQVEVAKQSISEVKDPAKKQEIKDKLATSIDSYQTKLTETQQKEAEIMKQIEETKKQLAIIKSQMQEIDQTSGSSTAPAPTNP